MQTLTGDGGRNNDLTSARKGSTFILALLLLTALMGCSSSADTDSAPDAAVDKEKPAYNPVKLSNQGPDKAAENAEGMKGNAAGQAQQLLPVSQTTGRPMKQENADGSGRAFAIMINNAPEARPQSGLFAADIVYELETEARITRFMAIYNDEIPRLLGPVRSAREYFIQLAQESRLVFVHHGGSPQAYQYLKDKGYRNLDGMTSNKFFRDKSRVAPHNSYIKGEDLDFPANVVNQHFQFINGEPTLRGESVLTIEIPYSGLFRSQYKYDPDTKKYARYISDKKHVDRETGEQIMADNIIVQYARHRLIPNDKEFRINIDLVGSGKIEYYLLGQKFTGTWEKKSLDSQTVFRNADGGAIELTPGKTWIQVVRQDMNIINGQ